MKGQGCRSDQPAPNQLERKLKERHVTMMAIGGSIGTGLFLGSGQAIMLAGPGGALAAYALMGVVVYGLMASLAELACRYPVSGSFSAYGSRFVEKSFGFALGWNYWLNWAITVALEVVAAAILSGYWFGPQVQLGFAGFALLSILLLNLASVRGFGEVEYWATWVKLATIALFLTLGCGRLLFNLGTKGPRSAFQFWYEGGSPFIGGWKGLIQAVLFAAFAFQGTELVGIAAGESEDPGRSLPKAISKVFWRILLFYCGSCFLTGTCLSPSDPRLGTEDLRDPGSSPFTILFGEFIGPGAAHLINFVVLSSVLSSANSGLYAASRTLHALARDGLAPRALSKLNRRGSPKLAVLVTAALSTVCLIGCRLSLGRAYQTLVSASSSAGLLAWIGIALSHYRFRKAWKAQGRSDALLSYQAPVFPWGPIVTLTVCLGLFLGYTLQVVHQVGFGGEALVQLGALYSMPIAFLTAWWLHKAYTRSTWSTYEAIELNGEGVLAPPPSTSASS